MSIKVLGAALLAAVMTVSVQGADEVAGKKEGKGAGQDQNVAAQLVKQLQDVNLTEEQTAKIKELGKAMAAKMKTLRDDAGITAELMKKRTDAQKALKDSGQKGKELAAAIDKEAGLSEAQAAAMAKIAALRQQFQREAIGLLTDEQKAKLPAALQRVIKAKGEARGKKKVDA
jgi:hypothetical protein